MKLRKLNRILHRDIGYFFFGMCIIYGISGIALNHRHHWNPNYIINNTSFRVNLPQNVSDELIWVEKTLESLDKSDAYKTHAFSKNNLRIFINGGTVNVNIITGEGNLETIKKRPVFNQINFLHYNTPRKLWTWFSDLFALGLIILAITGLFVLKGKNGFSQRGVYFVVTGIVIPLLLLYFYISG